jgi:hypothetical protein
LAVPRGDVLGEYDSYDEALAVMDRLVKSEFAIKGIAIVGSDLTTVERVTGRLSYGRAALAGGGSGAWLGLFVGLVLFLFSPAPEFSFILAAALIGAGFGMTFGIVSYAINRRRRDFSSTHHVLAGSYRIIIDPNQSARARQVLSGSTWPPVDAMPADSAGGDSAPAEGRVPASVVPADGVPADGVPAGSVPADRDPSDSTDLTDSPSTPSDSDTPASSSR